MSNVTAGTGLGFAVAATDGPARAGELVTAHGTIPTPAFMPVGTAGTVKAMKSEDVAATGAAIILANTYHLMLRPGAEQVAALGGLHAFMNWDGPILTDSGGYQVMSLAGLRTIREDGVTFRSHIDGAEHGLTPERAVEIQALLGSDITMVLDECTPFPVEESTARESMELSMRWAARCKSAFMPTAGRGLFGIVQGGVYEDLRAASVAALREIGFDGYAIGGLAVGEGQDEMFRIVEATAPGAARGRAPVSDGCRQARRYRWRGGARDRHVRLRPADPVGPHWPGLHPPRRREPAQRPSRR